MHVQGRILAALVLVPLWALSACSQASSCSSDEDCDLEYSCDAARGVCTLTETTSSSSSSGGASSSAGRSSSQAGVSSSGGSSHGSSGVSGGASTSGISGGTSSVQSVSGQSGVASSGSNGVPDAGAPGLRCPEDCAAVANNPKVASWMCLPGPASDLGNCLPATCDSAAGWTSCGDAGVVTCVDNTQTDPSNCGGCGQNVEPSGNRCVSGLPQCGSTGTTCGGDDAGAVLACQPSLAPLAAPADAVCCPAGLSNCGGTCVDISLDPSVCECTGATCTVLRCGDGDTRAGVEECDDGNDDNTDGCTNACKLATCGDGFIRPLTEACDDGNRDDTDTCTNACTPARCGDGSTWAGHEECDDGNPDNTDACTTFCTAAVCGDAFVQTGVEECDDGNMSDMDNCPHTCLAATCGDGFVFAGHEECDDGDMDATDACTTACKTPVCGDGFVHAGVETCDDANQSNTDACVACQPARCGDGFKGPGEDCDDGNMSDTDACVACHTARCGDGFVRAGTEQCDDGNMANTDACLNSCQSARCGDGFVRATLETCDDANTNDEDACTNACATAACGDGSVYAGVEACDNGPAGFVNACTSGCTLPNTRFVITADQADGQLLNFAADPSTGRLRAIQNHRTLGVAGFNDVALMAGSAPVRVACGSGLNTGLAALVLDATTGGMTTTGGTLYPSAECPTRLVSSPTRYEAIMLYGTTIRRVPYTLASQSWGTLASVTATGNADAFTDAKFRSDGLFLYAVTGAGKLSTFSANAATGALTFARSDAMASSQGVALHPRGLYAVVMGATSLQGVVLNTATGVPSASGAQVTGLGTNKDVTVEPSGRFAYVLTNGGALLASYRVNPATGALTAGATAATKGNSVVVVPDPSGKYLYVGSRTTDEVEAYAINAVTGAPTRVSRTRTRKLVSSILPVPGSVASSVARYFYASNETSSSVSQYSVNAATGALTALSPSTVSTGAKPGHMRLSASGNFLLVYEPGSGPTGRRLDTFTIAANGLLTPAGGVADSARDIRDAVLSPDNRYIWAVQNNTNQLLRFSITSPTTGAFNTAPLVSATTADGPVALGIPPAGGLIFVSSTSANNAGTVQSFVVDDETGVGTLAATVGAAPAPTDLWVEGSGRFLYGSRYNSSFGSVNQGYGWNISSAAGGLVAITGTPTTLFNSVMTGDAWGVRMFAVAKSNIITLGYPEKTFALNPETGELTLTGTRDRGLPLGSGAAFPGGALVSNQDGTLIYALSANYNEVESCVPAPMTGTLVPASTVSTGTKPMDGVVFQRLQ